MLAHKAPLLVKQAGSSKNVVFCAHTGQFRWRKRYDVRMRQAQLFLRSGHVVGPRACMCVKMGGGGGGGMKTRQPGGCCCRMQQQLTCIQAC